jgi:multiple sugar transport system ATP-binding protein
MSALAVRDVYKVFGSTQVLKGINLEVNSGEFTVLVGPSGCGKSTLLNIIAGLDTTTGGEIEIGGKPMNGVSAKDRDIAMVFQSYALYPSMTVRQNITFGMECRGVPRPERDAAVARVAKLLQIEQLLNRRPAQLSGGQRQRVAMGRALVRNPLLFLFDEPLSNLDAKLRVEMRKEIKLLHQTLGSTIIYVTHDQVEAMTLASRIAVLYQGELQQFADPDTIYNRPANLFVAQFMGSPPMNTMPGRLVSDGDGLSVVVRGDDGLQVSLPIAESGGFRNFVGRPVMLGIRPECITDAKKKRPVEPGVVIAQALVDMTEPTGAETMVLLRLCGHRAVGRAAPDFRGRIGQVVEFAFDTRNLCLFDPETERLIQ